MGRGEAVAGVDGVLRVDPGHFDVDARRAELDGRGGVVVVGPWVALVAGGDGDDGRERRRVTRRGDVVDGRDEDGVLEVGVVGQFVEQLLVVLARRAQRGLGRESCRRCPQCRPRAAQR